MMRPRAKAAGKPRRRRIDAARRAGPENQGAAGLVHAQGLFAVAAASIACSALALANAALAKPAATVALANAAIVIAAPPPTLNPKRIRVGTALL